VDAQHWLEDIGVPTNFAKPTAPVSATVLGRTRLITPDAPGDIQHILLQLPEGFHYVEGQSLSVIPDGIDAKTGKPHKPRLYSIASTRYGDLVDGRTVSLCVRRAEYVDPVTGQVDPSKAGVCSNFLCNSQPGQIIQVAGPVGKTMLLPEDSSKDIIMVATGTGIAPFRAFLHRLFMENTVARHLYTGTAWLILGVPTTGGLLYPQEFAAMQRNGTYGLYFRRYTSDVFVC
jgi:ferredoxin--NADP+ reductase